MTKKKLKEILKEINKWAKDDQEIAHSKADNALLEYIDDNKITEAFDAIPKWYA